MRIWRAKSQTLTIVLIIMATLAIITLKMAENVNLALKESNAQKEGARAYYMAKSGINTAVEKIKGKEKRGFYSLEDDLTQEDEKINFSYKVTDEERRFNINNTSDVGTAFLKQILTQEANLSDEEAANLAKFCGQAIEKKELMNKLELMVILEEYFEKESKGNAAVFAREIYSNISDYITANGTEKVNINTAPETVLKSLIAASIKSYLPAEANLEDSGALSSAIMQLRLSGGYIEAPETQEIKDKLTAIGHNLSAQEENIISVLCENFLICTNSEIFNIASTGHSGSAKKEINAKYDYASGNIIDWNEK